MDWTQTFTIIFTIISSMLVALYVFYHISKEDRNLMRESHREDMKRHDTELAEVRQEFSRTHALWADLLRKIHDVQLSQSNGMTKA